MKMRMFDCIIVAHEPIPNLDDMSKQLEEFYGDGFVEVSVKSEPDVVPNILGVANEIIDKLNSASDQAFANNYGGELMALVRYTQDVGPFYGMIIDMIIEDKLCRDIYYIQPKKTGTITDDPSEVPLEMIKYDTTINERGTECRDLVYTMDMEYDGSTNLILYLSDVYMKYLNIVEALEGLSNMQKIQLLKCIAVNQYVEEASGASDKEDKSGEVNE